MSRRRLALLVATYRYQDAGLRQLTAPGHDAQALANVLRDPEIADFDVTVLINEPHYVVGEAIGEFYRNRRRDDLTLLYFTGHGLKDDQGRLYLAMTNTKRDSLLFTALSAEQIDDAMESCSSRQKVLMLDCCYSGAFPAGRISKADPQVHALEKFQGKGRVVLTASDATQYSFEGNHIVGQGTRSVFTRFLVEGLTTGEADLDDDGDISLDELYSYVHDRVIEETPQQRPKKQENVEGRIVIARNIHWRPHVHVRNAIESALMGDRLAVLQGLAHLHRDGNELIRAEVINQIRGLIHDDNAAVSAAAMELMTALNFQQARRETEEKAKREELSPDPPAEQRHPRKTDVQLAPVVPPWWPSGLSGEWLRRPSTMTMVGLVVVLLLGLIGVVVSLNVSGQSTAHEAPNEAGPSTKCDPPQAKASGQPSIAPLKIGTLLPETGSLAFLGPPEFAAVDVAVKEVNAAGGVLGNPVTHVRGDSGDDKTDTANQTVDRELSQGVQAIVGAAASGATKLVIDKITGAGVVEFSPANTSDEFTCWADKGLYFRTAPPDFLQAQALAALMIEEGAQRISVLARNDSYGSGLADNTVQNLRDAGIPQNQVQKIIYDPNATSYNAEIDDVRQFNPDAIAVIGFDESKKIITRMSEVQIGPAQKRIYGTDGNMGNATGVGLPPGLLNGMKGTTPLTELSPTFEQRLKAEDPALVDNNYAGEAYDAIMILTLAAEQAKSTKGVDIASEINGITKDGEKCTTFRQCRDIIDSGGNPDYDGVTGTLDFTAAGERAVGSYGILTFNAQNQIDDAATRYRIVGAER